MHGHRQRLQQEVLTRWDRIQLPYRAGQLYRFLSLRQLSVVGNNLSVQQLGGNTDVECNKACVHHGGNILEAVRLPEDMLHVHPQPHETEAEDPVQSIPEVETRKVKKEGSKQEVVAK